MRRPTRAMMLALAELNHKGARGLDGWTGVHAAALDNPVARKLASAGLILTATRQMAVSLDGRRLLAISGLLLKSLPSVREDLEFPARHGLSAYSTGWLNIEVGQ